MIRWSAPGERWGKIPFLIAAFGCDNWVATMVANSEAKCLVPASELLIRMARIRVNELTFAFDFNGTDVSRSLGKGADFSFFLFKVWHEI